MNNLTDLWHSFEAKIAGFVPGWKTIALGTGLASINIFDILQQVYQVIPGLETFVPEPYKTVINIALPILMTWTTNLRGRVENRTQTPATPPAVAQ
jgi:hypothetical protein